VAATMAMKMYQYNLNSALGSDNMRFLAGISNEDKRIAAEAALIKGKSPDTVKIESRRIAEPPDPRVMLEKEKARLERTITALSKRLEEIEQQLQ
jgi:hypothetical protein